MRSILSHILRRRPSLPQDFAATAIISVYDDAIYLERCFQNMAELGVEAIVIDNDCVESTREIVERHKGGVIREVVRHPREGIFDWTGILRFKQEIANTRKSDWMLLWDSDEIREAPQGAASFRDALREADEAGHTTVNFHEFVFLPVSRDEDFRGRDYVAGLETYYYFAPRRQHRANAWRVPEGKVELMSGAGHLVSFARQSISPVDFALRHYLFLSYEHGKQKYLGRAYSTEDMAKGWSRERARTTSATFRLPDASMMKRKVPGQDWDLSDPRRQHPTFVYEGSATDGV